MNVFARTSRAPLVGAALAICVLTRGAGAQSAVGSIDVGGTSLRSDSLNGSALTIGPSLRAEWSRLSLDASGTYSQFGTSGWNMQGGVESSLFTPAAGPLSGELAGTLAGNVQETGAHTGEMLGTGRVHLMSRNAGLWLGAGTGESWYGGGWRSVRTTEGGVWAKRGRTTGVFFATPTTVGDTTRYTDLQAGARWLAPRLEIAASFAKRVTSSGTIANSNRTTWGGASATAWIAPRAAIVASVGAYPVDYAQGYPGGRYVSLGMRLTTGPDTPEDLVMAEGRGRSVAIAGPGGLTQLDVGPAVDGRRSVRVFAPTARQVELSGDFTNWQPVALVRGGDGWWTTRASLGSGLHEVSVRVDGGAWVVPPGMSGITDEFGDVSAPLLVP